MKILHLCLSNWYVDGNSYQENILPKIQFLHGHDVKIIASTETYLNHKKIGYVLPSEYFTEHNIPIKRLAYQKLFNHFLTKKLRFYKGLYREIESFEPEIIFIHGHHFCSIYEVKRYAQNNPSVKIFVDSHSDYYNCAKTWLSKNVLHKIVYKWCARQIEPFAEKFYGTLPIRCEFLHEVYSVPREKIEFLPFGVDDSDMPPPCSLGSGGGRVGMSSEFGVFFYTRFKSLLAELRSEHREHRENSEYILYKRYKETKNDYFIIITGGRVEKRKKILDLMRVVKKMDREDIKLLIFGSVVDEIKDEFYGLLGCNEDFNDTIIFLGWLRPDEVYSYFLASDLAVFPGTHSVLWEKAVGCGLPCVFKYMKGIDHVDLGGNCRFLHENTDEELERIILELYNDREKLNTMRQIAKEKGKDVFSYKRIAMKIL